MADETTPTPPTTPEPTATDKNPVPYERFAEVNKAKNDLATRLAQLEAAQKTQAEQTLAEQNRWKELAEQRAKELDGLKTSQTRLEVAMAKGLPPALAARLVGATREEMEADADTLLTLVKTNAPTPPGVPPAPNRQAGSGEFTAAQLADPEFVRKNATRIFNGAA